MTVLLQLWNSPRISCGTASPLSGGAAASAATKRTEISAPRRASRLSRAAGVSARGEDDATKTLARPSRHTECAMSSAWTIGGGVAPAAAAGGSPCWWLCCCSRDRARCTAASCWRPVSSAADSVALHSSAAPAARHAMTETSTVLRPRSRRGRARARPASSCRTRRRRCSRSRRTSGGPAGSARRPRRPRRAPRSLCQ